ncbi:long-chain fatty acid transporter [Flavipsychrobacter stenotrophus]|uniref:Long-chain fatty acid transporter n=1 Tax=Flavipsychrobacter stenotrophus TaxID=2077091 RepID=A0A2S7SVS1_9BACT|nr:outer membrane protein transport protein [Flavipsychrobacter stenotrophus]PQJ10824.1 long-chain fatty acid transporter [Flavipsychrobacter stenotrophus]
MKKHLLAASMVLASFSSIGAGYQLNLQGIRQLAMGGTGTAMPWDASTIFYNPGGLSRLKGIQVYGSILGIMPSTAYGNYYLGSTKSVKQTFTPFNLYVGGPIREGSRVGLGLGIYTPFGSGLKWDDNWTGRYIVQSIELKSFFFQPTISYRFSNFLSGGIGLIYATGTFDFKQALPVQNSYEEAGTLTLHGNANGVGFNAGLQMKFSDRFQVGLTYRSQVTMNIGGGSANFNVPSSLRSNFPNTRFETFLPLPQVASIGFAIKPLNNERLTLQLDFNYTGWNSYDSLRINFAEHTTSLQDNHAPRHYRNTLTTRLGANYKISKVVSVMAGGAYDPTPVVNGYVTPDLPDADHIVVTMGAAIKPIKRFTILAACEFVTTPKRNSTYDFAGFSGTFWTQAITPGIGIYYNF